MKNKPFRLFPSSIAASFILLSPALHAAIIWDADGGLGATNWSTPANWNPDTADVTGEDVTFNATGATASGTTNTVDDITLLTSINSLSYSFEDAANQHTTAIGAGQTLTVAGDFLLAGSTTAVDPTNVTLTGATGALTVGGTSFQVGQLSPVSGTTTNSLDLSGLESFNANLGSGGTFRMGANSGVTAGTLATVKLAATSSITANILSVGDRAGRGGTHTLKLGSAANTIHANTISVGSTGGRGNGDLSFETGTGTLTLRAADGTAAVTAMNLINSGFGTSNNLTATVDFAGHSVDAKIGTLTMGRRVTTTAASATSTFTFDTGILEVGTLNLGQNGSTTSTSGTINATMNIGGGDASFNAINMATSTGGAATTTNATLNLTGGTTTVTGNIAEIGGSGTINAKVILDGAILDMDNGNIGDSTNAVALTLASGTLQNVAEVNGGGTVTKTSGGAITFTGNNTFTGSMNFFGGDVTITGNSSFGTGAKNINIQVGAVVVLDGTAGDITLPANMTLSTAGPSFRNTVGDNVVNGAISVIAGSATTEAISNGGSLTLTGDIAPGAAITTPRNLKLSGSSTGANTVSGAVTDGALTFLNLVKSGAGTWSLTSASNTYSGNTTVEEGTLRVSTPNFADDSTVSIGTLANPGAATLNLPNAGDDTVAILSIDGVVQPGGKTYGNSSSILPVIATSAITGPGTLTVPVGLGTPYTDWADTFLPENDVSDPAGDNDKDGLVNQQEFAFGLSPIDGSSVNPILVQLDKTAGTFTYQRRANTGLTYRILTSMDLASWPEDTTATLTGQAAGPVDGNGNQSVVVTLTGSKPLTATKLFVRVAAD
jgi:autotransporter-associated beta strand protein